MAHRAGLIPYWIDTNNKIYMLFMKPSNPDFGGPDFQISKGKIESGYSELETAIKEAKEELGLRIDNIKSQPIFVGNFMKGICIYAVEVYSKDDFDEPEYETSETKWMTLDEFKQYGRKLHLYAVYNVHRKISSIINKNIIKNRGENQYV
jgi:8-oxo-dGTP pyrophosphatase MutT (NUDIX family)